MKDMQEKKLKKEDAMDRERWRNKIKVLHLQISCS